MRILQLSLLAVPFVVACGGGPSDSTKLADLSVSEARDLCEESVDANPLRTITCEGQPVEWGIDPADCAASDVNEVAAGCTATVGQARDCFDALGALSDAEVCALTSLPAACAAISDC